MSESRSPQIILGISGSIAAYKAAELASGLTQAGCAVHVVMTEAACRFITPLTLASLTHRPVITSLWDEHDSHRPTHIQLADEADLVLLAPATANLLAKMAHGLADDVLTSILLATRAPILVAPAMNGKMWDHPATQANVETLRQRGVQFIGPEEGLLACGYEGLGRLCSVPAIQAKALQLAKGGE